ncbi:tetratricopeptide repeat protein [Actinoplanes sichuanensis]|nr:tetratricopeptide repeat protein [Actinoplanes sichuanensis]
MPLSGDPLTAPAEVFTALPDPGQANSVADLVERLRLLKVWAGDPSYKTIKDRVNKAWTAAGRPASELTRRSTVAYCFRSGRRRLDTNLVLAVIQALHPDTGYVTQWRQALRVVGGEIEAVSRVRVQASLPPDLAGFTGRTRELDRLGHAAQNGQTVVISAIEGMAGVGKTQLAVRAGHLLHQRQPFERVLFVNLRGFDPDPAQPPADPAAVLDGFLRLLGMPGQQIPHTLDARVAAYRDRLAGSRALVVLDNAATTEQVRPLLTTTPGCLTLVTSRRRLANLRPATHLSVDVFTPGEALAFLAQAVPEIPVGQDPHAAARITRRCDYLPLALSLITGHIRNTPGWTLTDHADRLDERHRDRRLDTGMEMALQLSYQHLSADQQRLLRLLALHPGHDFDAYAAAALTDVDLATAQALLESLRSDHLLQQAESGRYAFLDLIRAYATTRSHDEDPPSARHAALTRLFDHYIATVASTMSTLHPAETHLLPRLAPVGTPTPVLTDADRALLWLDTERSTLIAVAIHTATHGWHSHAIRLSVALHYYLIGDYPTDALTVHSHAHHVARQIGDPSREAHVLTRLGGAYGRLGQYETSAEHLQQALGMHRVVDDPVGEGRTLACLGALETRRGNHRLSAHHLERAIDLLRQVGDPAGWARALNNLGFVEARLGSYRLAAEHLRQALLLYRQVGNPAGKATALTNLGEVEAKQCLHGSATEHLHQALALCRQSGFRAGEGWTMNSLGTLYVGLARPAEATEHYQDALAIFREIHDRAGEVSALNGLGEAAHTAGRLAESVTHHTAANTIAAEIPDRDQQARSHTGLGHAQRALGSPVHAHSHYRRALALYTDLGLPEADQIRTHLAQLDNSSAEQR